MTSSERRETSGKSLAPAPVGVSFAELLDWHLRWGTRPGGEPGTRGREWNNKAFADAVDVNERSVRNWRTGRSRPTLYLDRILEALFQREPQYQAWREGLHDAIRLDDQRAAAFTPPQPPYFLGREAELKAMHDCLSRRTGSTSILVQGGPGIGKTALTAAFAGTPELLERVSEVRRWFVRGETMRSDRALQLEIARTLGVGSTQSFPGCLVKLAEAPALIVIDNLETAWDEVSERRPVEATLAEIAALPGVILVASFRGADRVAGPPWDLVLPLNPLSPPSAEELFRRFAQNVPENDPHLARFTEALGGVPLAIELVGSRAWVADTLGDLWDEWCKIGTRLATRPDFRRTRKSSLERSIELSLQSRRITPAALRLFAYLGQLPAGISASDRDKLMGDEGFEASERLCRVGLAFWKGPRLQMLAPVRDFAARHHKPNKKASLRWPRHYLDLTRDLGEQLGMAGDDGIYRRLRQELPNVQAAFNEYLQRKSLGKPLGALSGLFRIATLSGTEMPVIADIAAACVDRTKVSWQGTCLHTVGCIAYARGDDETAEHALEAAFNLYTLGGYERGIAVALHGLGSICRHRGDLKEAETYFSEALEIISRATPEGSSNCFISLGWVRSERGDTAGAQGYYERALKLDIHTGDRLGQAGTLLTLAYLYEDRREFAQARARLDEALTLYEALQYAPGMARAHLHRAYAEHRSGREEAARVSSERALALYRDETDLSGQGECYEFFAALAKSRRDLVLYGEHLQTALELYRQAGDVRGEADVLGRLARLAHDLADYATAEPLYREFIALGRRLKRRQQTAEGFGDLGYVLIGLSRINEARAVFEEAKTLFEALGEMEFAEECVQAIARLGPDRDLGE